MRLPNNWLWLEPYGDLIPGTPFLPIKVPLDSNYDYHFDNSSITTRRFELIDSINEIKSYYGKNISAIVDLTNTDRYYDKSIVLRLGIKHIKLSVEGHSVLPTLGDVTAFINETAEIIKSDPHSIIIVHCTHGYNRTGYMICSYLCSKFNMSPREALQTFRKQRSPGIYKASYIDALHLRFSSEAPIPSDISYPKERSEDDESREFAIVSSDGLLDKDLLAEAKLSLQQAMGQTQASWLVISEPKPIKKKFSKRLRGEGV